SLATDVSARNPHLNLVELNNSVQNLIDRVIFLRIAEARGLEQPDALLSTITNEPGVYKRLLQLFFRADDRYNSGLFHFQPHKDMKSPIDYVGLHLQISDDILKRIIERLYYPEPYEFSVLPADLLGKIYEQFLGEVITLDEDGYVTVDVKPDVRKAGGIYYTPVPVVEYIVEQTIGPLLKGKEPKDVAKLRIVDPACGSGSFLIAVYQYILNWHRDYYADKPRLAKRFLELGTDGFFRLKTSERKKILQN